MEIHEFIEKFKVTLDFDKSIIITPETQFQQIDGWSSIMIVQLVVMFDEEFGKEKVEEFKNNARAIINGDYVQLNWKPLKKRKNIFRFLKCKALQTRRN